jgi:type II secretory pathway pseudopilin PulG
MTSHFQHRRQRLGKSLLEALVIISLLSLVMGLAVTSLSTLFRVRQQVQRDSEQGAAISRLAARLRSDAHEAVSASANDRLELALANGRTIHYTYAETSIVRQVRRDDTILHHDTFRLSRTGKVAFEKQGAGPTSLIRLSIRPVESRLPPRDISRAATIEAAVGLNSRLAEIARQP